MKRIELVVAAFSIAAAAFAAPVAAQKEQFIPANFYWVGPYAPGGSGFGGGIIDYFAMLNERDGGINGVKLTWEKCETEYNNARGVEDRKSTRLNSSHRCISYAVFCLKKKKK